MLRLREDKGTRGGDGTAETLWHLVEREEVSCASGSGGSGGRVMDGKMGEGDERGARENSPQSGRRLRVDRMTGPKEKGRKETRHKETGSNEKGAKETGASETAGKAME